MTTPNRSTPATPVDAVLGALEQLTQDLRLRTEAAESRAGEAERRLDLERAARQEAEARAAAAEHTAQEVLRRTEAMEAATREGIRQLRQDLLAAFRGHDSPAPEGAPARPPTPEPLRAAEAEEAAPRSRRAHDLAYIAEPTTGRTPGAPAQRNWDRDERGYAWVEDEPGPSWWRRLFGRHY